VEPAPDRAAGLAVVAEAAAEVVEAVALARAADPRRYLNSIPDRWPGP
jgi:hypothetical protein